MNKVIIITGISGTGKTTLAKMLYNKIEDSVLLSNDKLSENIYDMVGFKNKDEKRALQILNVKIYKNLLEECMRRRDKVIILENPFKREWIEFFKRTIHQYNYEVCTINMFAESFDVIWERLLKREKSKKDRHPSHYLDSYCPKKKEDYKPYFEYEYYTLKEEYDNLTSNDINLGKVINVEDIKKVDADKLIAELLS